MRGCLNLRRTSIRHGLMLTPTVQEGARPNLFLKPLCTNANVLFSVRILFGLRKILTPCPIKILNASLFCRVAPPLLRSGLRLSLDLRSTGHEPSFALRTLHRRAVIPRTPSSAPPPPASARVKYDAAGAPVGVSLFGAARSFSVHKPGFEAVTVVNEDSQDMTVPLHFTFTYHPGQGFVPIHEVIEGRKGILLASVVRSGPDAP